MPGSISAQRPTVFMRATLVNQKDLYDENQLGSHRHVTQKDIILQFSCQSTLLRQVVLPHNAPL